MKYAHLTCYTGCLNFEMKTPVLLFCTYDTLCLENVVFHGGEGVWSQMKLPMFPNELVLLLVNRLVLLSLFTSIKPF